MEIPRIMDPPIFCPYMAASGSVMALGGVSFTMLMRESLPLVISS